MKKLAILLLVLLLSGCTVVRIDTSDLNNIVDVVLSKDNTLFNQVGKGYKYYIPVGVSYIDTEDFQTEIIIIYTLIQFLIITMLEKNMF